MKLQIKHIALLSIGIFLLSSCTKKTTTPEPDPTEPQLELIKSFEVNGHEILLKSFNAELKAGYNEIYFQIKDKATGTALELDQSALTPIMHMTSMMHSCPHSELTAMGTDHMYKAFVLFQMPGNTSEYWELKLDYHIEGAAYTASLLIDVKPEAQNHRSTLVFQDSSGDRYVLAHLPMVPEVAVNDFTAVLYRMDNMMSFSPVADYEIKIDPRMPAMGNHSSPNNLDFIYNDQTGLYEGSLSLTMTGYWVVNLQVFDNAGKLVKGEKIEGAVTQSSIYFELEF